MFKSILVAFGLLLTAASAHAATVTATDVFDVTQGGTIAAASVGTCCTNVNSVSAAENLIGGKGGTVETTNLLMGDSDGLNHLSSFILTTASAVTLGGFNLFLASDGTASPDNRAITDVIFSVYNGGPALEQGSYTELLSFTMGDPYSATAAQPGINVTSSAPNVAVVEASFAPVTGSVFLFQFTQASSSATVASGPRLQELDAVLATNVVPLPAGLPLLLAGLGGFALLRQRSARAAANA